MPRGPYSTGDEIQVRVGELGEDGRARGTLFPSPADNEGVERQPRTLWVEGGLPGEHVRARVMHVGKHQAIARTLSWEEASDTRREDLPCPRWTPDSPCRVMHLTDEAQQKFKRDRLRSAFTEHAFDPELIQEVLAPSEALGSRSKVSFVVARRQGQIVLGAFRRGTHAVQPMVECALPEPALRRATAALYTCLGRAGCPIANPGLRVVPDPSCGRPDDDWSGRPAARKEEHLVKDGLRYVVMRSNRAGQVAALLLTPSGELPLASLLAQDLQRECPAFVAIYLGKSGPGNAMLDPKAGLRLVEGAPLEDELGDLRYRVSPAAFFQVNRDAADALHAQVRDQVRGERILDVYCGAGAITLRMAQEGRLVVGIERNAQAIEAAKQGAEDNGLGALVHFEEADAREYLHRAHEISAAFDTVVFNPPRKGCDAEVLSALPALGAERVVYVSCNPKTLARDAARLRGQGYALQAVTPYDLFPHSEHVEALAVFTRLSEP